MLDMETLGYFLYMEEQDRLHEEEQKRKYVEVNIETDDDLVAERATNKGKE